VHPTSALTGAAPNPTSACGQPSEHLRQALESRFVIEEAKGITEQRKSITVDHAYQLMRGHARSNHPSLRTVAEAIVAWDFRSDPGGRPRRSGVSHRAPTPVQDPASVPSLVSNVLKMPRWV
jgi:hypothetical protein